jgi:hypothetical protein
MAAAQGPRVDQFWGNTAVRLVIDPDCTNEGCEAFARQHPDIQSLTVHVADIWCRTQGFCSMIALLPNLVTLEITLPLCCAFDAEFATILPRVTSLKLTGFTYLEPPDSLPLLAGLRTAQRLEFLFVYSSDNAAFVLDAVPSSLRELVIGSHGDLESHWPLPLQTEAALQRYLLRADPPLDYIQLRRRASPTLVRFILEKVNRAVINVVETDVLQFIRARPGRKLQCWSLNTNDAWLAPTDHQDRVAALADSAALPVAHLPELTALFLL